MVEKVLLLIVFFGIMIAVGLYSRKHATNVNDSVLGGRAVGPWLTAFAYGTSYFSAVVFVGYAGQFGYKHRCIRVLRYRVRSRDPGNSACYL